MNVLISGSQPEPICDGMHNEAYVQVGKWIRVIEMPKYGMLVEANKCIGCSICTKACKDEYVGNDYLPYSVAQPNPGYGVSPRPGRGSRYRGSQHVGEPGRTRWIARRSRKREFPA